MDLLIQHINQHIGKPAACAHCDTAVHHGFGCCQHCPTVLYCSAACQEMDWKNGHFAACSGRTDGESDWKKLKQDESIDYVDMPADLKALLLHYLSLEDLNSAVRLSEVNKAYTKVFRERFVTRFIFHFFTDQYKDDAFRALAPFIKKIAIIGMDIFDYAKDMSFAPTKVRVLLQTPLDLRKLPDSARVLGLKFARGFAYDNKVNYVMNAPKQLQKLRFQINPLSLANFAMCKIHHLQFWFVGHVKRSASFAWPRRIEWLQISSTEGLPLERIAYPPNLKRLQIDDLHHDLNDLPLTLEYLSIFELDLHTVVPPASLRHLSLGDGIGFEIVEWPPNLETLLFVGGLTKESYHALPQSISKMLLDIDEDVRLNKWPAMLKELLFYNIPGARLENLPPQLEVIGFFSINHHNDPVRVIDYLPRNLKEIHISNDAPESVHVKVPEKTQFIISSREWFSDEFPEIDY